MDTILICFNKADIISLDVHLPFRLTLGLTMENSIAMLFGPQDEANGNNDLKTSVT